MVEVGSVNGPLAFKLSEGRKEKQSNLERWEIIFNEQNGDQKIKKFKFKIQNI